MFIYFPAACSAPGSCCPGHVAGSHATSVPGHGTGHPKIHLVSAPQHCCLQQRVASTPSSTANKSFPGAMQGARQRLEALSWVPRSPLTQLHRAAIWLMSDNISSLVLSTPAICFTFTPCYPIPPALHCTRLLNSSVCICPHQTRADPTTEAARTCNRVRQRLSRVPFKKIKTKKHAICTELGCICY